MDSMYYNSWITVVDPGLFGRQPSEGNPGPIYSVVDLAAESWGVGSHFFVDLFLQDREGHGPLGPLDLLLIFLEFLENYKIN